MRKLSFLLLFLPVTLPLLSGCGGLQKVGAKTTASIIYDTIPEIDAEEDVELARHTSLGTLKMLEALHQQNPKDKRTLILLTRAYAGFAFGFTENNMLRHKGTNEKAYQMAKQRAQRFYNRSRGYAMKLLALLPGMSNPQEMPFRDFENALKKIGEKDVESLFWIGFAWGNYVNFNKDSIEAVADMPRIESIMNRIIEIDESYYYGGPHLFLGAYYGNRPKMLGGNPALSYRHFQKAIELTNGKNLMARVTLAQYYAIQMQDSKLYTQALQQVLNGNPAALPEIRLVNELAQQRAEILLKKKSMFFNTRR